MVKVLRADRSPLNKKQWLCELECGHEQWVTSARKPSKTHCYECDFPVVEAVEHSVHPTAIHGGENPNNQIVPSNADAHESGGG